MDPAVTVSLSRKGLDIGRQKLGLCPVFENFCRQGIKLRKLLQDAGVGGVARAGLFPWWEFFLFKKDRSQLFWRGDVEFVTGQRENFLLNRGNLPFKLHGIVIKVAGIDMDSVKLHLSQNRKNFHLHVPEKPGQILVIQPFFKKIPELQGKI